jgi:hypothetical protein
VMDLALRRWLCISFSLKRTNILFSLSQTSHFIQLLNWASEFLAGTLSLHIPQRKVLKAPFFGFNSTFKCYRSQCYCKFVSIIAFFKSAIVSLFFLYILIALYRKILYIYLQPGAFFSYM